jgi:hypothetical protein
LDSFCLVTVSRGSKRKRERESSSSEEVKAPKLQHETTQTLQGMKFLFRFVKSDFCCKSSLFFEMQLNDILEIDVFYTF